MSLKWRLAWTLIVLLVGIGSAIAWAGRYASQLYFQEVNQSLNANLSMYVVERLTLIEDGSVNQNALRDLADQAMTVNPSVEVYLVDPTGTVLAHGLPDDSILHRRVGVEPIKAFISGTRNQLILGQDPRSNTRKAFSASPIMHGNELQGYLYVILGGRHFDQVQASFLSTFIGRMAAAILLVVLMVGGVAGLIALRRTTAPLESLQVALQSYTDSGFVEAEQIWAIPENTMEVKQLKRQVTQMTTKLAAQFEQADTHQRLRRELLANISHDLRTPLASMQGYLETLMLKGDALSAIESKRYIEVAHKHTQRLNRMVGNLFELAKLDSGAVQPNLEPFPIAELLNDVMQEFELAAADKDISLTVKGLETRSRLMVLADISLIQRVLENLLGNALRHTPRGGQIEIALMPGPQAIDINVRDSGGGIRADLLPKIFERYASGDGTEESTGLGLAIVKRILELHESRIHVTSAEAQGTCFSFNLHRVAA